MLAFLKTQSRDPRGVVTVTGSGGLQRRAKRKMIERMVSLGYLEANAHGDWYITDAGREARDAPPTYSTRSAAIAAARLQCRRLIGLNYEAAEGPDFGIHPASNPAGFRYRWYVELRGPAKAAADAGGTTP